MQSAPDTRACAEIARARLDISRLSSRGLVCIRSDFFYWHSASVRAAPTSSHVTSAHREVPHGLPPPLQVELLQLLEQLLA